MKISSRRLEILLAEKGMTAKALALASGISGQSISTIKARGTCNPCTAAKLANALNVQVAEIIEEG